MGKKRFGGDTTVTSMLGDDGRVYFQTHPKPMTERIFEAVMGVLWLSAGGIVAAFFWF